MDLTIVLSNTSHQGNIGASARAIKAMGFNKLYLVDPKSPPNEEAIARATHASEMLKNCIKPNLKTALAENELVFGTTARPRHLNLPVISSKEMQKFCKHKKIAVLFGNERTGLTNEELGFCNMLVNIPTDPNCSSLNLGAAVQIIAYELSQIKAPEQKTDELAKNIELQNFYAHLLEVIQAVDFINPTSSKIIMQKICCLFQRAKPLKTEIAILRGILTSVQRKLK